MVIIKQIRRMLFRINKCHYEVKIFHRTSCNSKSFRLDPDTILRMAEYQAMVYCQPSSGSSPSDISAIENMANKNLRVGEFVIEATGFDKNGYLFWYIASNTAQQSIILVHRGTVSSNHVC